MYRRSGAALFNVCHGLWLRLPPGASIDLELMQARAARAERMLACNNLHEALDAAREALALAQRRPLPEFAEPWVEERRREIDTQSL
jgi:hypothetical protein